MSIDEDEFVLCKVSRGFAQVYGMPVECTYKEYRHEAAKSSDQPVELTERVARAIASSIYRSEGLETMNYSSEQDYANREWKHYEREATAAVTECCRAKIIDGEMLCPKCGYTARATADQSVKENADSSHVSGTGAVMKAWQSWQGKFTLPEPKTSPELNQVIEVLL